MHRYLGSVYYWDELFYNLAFRSFLQLLQNDCFKMNDINFPICYNDTIFISSTKLNYLGLHLNLRGRGSSFDFDDFLMKTLLIFLETEKLLN